MLAAITLLAGGCSLGAPDVEVYSTLDAGYAQPVLGDAGSLAHVTVEARFDADTTPEGLAERIIAQANEPRCDVFWNNEILNTLRLEKRGLLEAYRPASADEYSAAWHSPKDLWYGLAARARVLVIDRRRMARAEWPRSVRDLANAQWKGRCGIAAPLYGTTATHAACLFVALGDAEAKRFFRQLKANQLQIYSSNRQLVQAVERGDLAFALADTDDAVFARELGAPLEIVYPDQGEGGLGTLFIPNTVALIRGCPHPEAARRLLDALLTLRVELTLANGPTAQIPLNVKARSRKARVETPRTVQAMSVDFQAAADKFPQVVSFLREEFGP